MPQKVGEEFVRHDAADPVCAGILFVHDGKLFLCHRTDRDEWEGPGGHIEAGETPAQAAIRETEEETGLLVAERILSAPMLQPGGEYVAFVANVGDTLEVELNHEHDDSGWFPFGELPESTHPNIKEWAKRMPHRSDAQSATEPTTELDIAKAIRDGKLPSPQRLDHVWLFDLRVTGTGVAYRASLDEWVFRPPEYYLNDEFLERCQGVAVLFGHPDKGLMTTQEWRQRAIGALALPYIPTVDDEYHSTSDVWAIARIYDDDAAELMLRWGAKGWQSEDIQDSTSPAVDFNQLKTRGGPHPSVTFGDPPPMKYIRTEDGEKMLIEGNPPYFDHVGVVDAGVWDKLDTPRGVAQ